MSFLDKVGKMLLVCLLRITFVSHPEPEARSNVRVTVDSFITAFCTSRPLWFTIKISAVMITDWPYISPSAYRTDRQEDTHRKSLLVAKSILNSIPIWQHHLLIWTKPSVQMCPLWCSGSDFLYLNAKTLEKGAQSWIILHTLRHPCFHHWKR